MACGGSKHDKQLLSLESCCHLNSHVVGHVSVHWDTKFSHQSLTSVPPGDANNTLPCSRGNVMEDVDVWRNYGIYLHHHCWEL